MTIRSAWKALVSPIWRRWGSWAVSSVAAGLAFLVPPPVIVSVSQELIALFGLLLAGALPTMILTATILRAGAFSPKRVGQYAEALDSQLSFWFGLFIWALFACVSIMVSKALWDIHSPYRLDFSTPSMGKVQALHVVVEWSRVADMILGLTGAQVVYRLFPMLAGLRSLLRLNSLIATEEAARNAQDKLNPGRQDLSAAKPPGGHGSFVKG